MPRNENPLNPQAGPVAAFAADLRALRRQAGGITYRALAKRAGYSVTTLSVAASGVALPSLEVTLAYVQACGADPRAWQARWYETAAQQQCEQHNGGHAVGRPAVNPVSYSGPVPQRVAHRPGDALTIRTTGVRIFSRKLRISLLVVSVLAASCSCVFRSDSPLVL